MVTISRLDEDKSLNGKIGEHWAKNGEKFPIVRHYWLDVTRSVRRDACSNFLLPRRGESAERANAKSDRASVFWRKKEVLRIKMFVPGEGATKYFDAALTTSKYYKKVTQRRAQRRKLEP
jgi:hypothetical protein